MVDECGLYERFCLEGFQSASLVDDPAKARGFRSAVRRLRPRRVARFTERDVQRLLGDAGIVRHRGKIEATIANARGVLELREAGTPCTSSCGRSPRSATTRRSNGRLARADTGVEGALEAAEGRGLPLRRPDDGLGGDAGLRDRQRPPGHLLGASRRRDGSARRRLALEQPLQPLEVLPELPLGPAGHDPCGEAGQHAGVALADHRQSRPASARLELVAHAERRSGRRAPGA